MKKIFAALCLVLTVMLFVACGNEDPFAGKTWEGSLEFITKMETTLEFSNSKSVVVNLGVYDNEKGSYIYDSQSGAMTIKLEKKDPLRLEYNKENKKLVLKEGLWVVEYKEKNDTAITTLEKKSVRTWL